MRIFVNSKQVFTNDGSCWAICLPSLNFGMKISLNTLHSPTAKGEARTLFFLHTALLLWEVSLSLLVGQPTPDPLCGDISSVRWNSIHLPASLDAEDLRPSLDHRERTSYCWDNQGIAPVIADVDLSDRYDAFGNKRLRQPAGGRGLVGILWGIVYLSCSKNPRPRASLPSRPGQ